QMPLGLLVALPVAVREPDTANLRPSAVFQGSHSQVKNETFRLIETEAAWKELWKQHRGTATDRRYTEPDLAFNIDFDTQYVVAIFAGKHHWCTVTPRQWGESVVIRFEARGHQVIGLTPGADFSPEEKRAWRKQAKQNEAAATYAFVVLPKPVRTVVIEQGTR